MATFILVLQWAAEGIEAFDALLALEDEISGVLSEDTFVDGHDVGCSELNLFIRTGDPSGTLRAVQSSGLLRGSWAESMAAGYRSAHGANYTVLWPPGRTEFRVR